MPAPLLHTLKRAYVLYVPPMTDEGKYDVLGARCTEEVGSPRRVGRAVAVRVYILHTKSISATDDKRAFHSRSA